MQVSNFKEQALCFFSLFGSASTLVCCALPALFVSLGAGATLVTITSNYPQLIWISQHKFILFVISGALLLATGVLRHKQNSLSCPSDPRLAKACSFLHNLSTAIFWLSVSLYSLGFYFAYITQFFI